MEHMYQQPSNGQGLLANRKLLLIIGGTFVAIFIAIGALIMGGSNGNIQTSLQHLSSRYDNLATLTQAVGSSHLIYNEDLSKLNSEASIVFTSDASSFASLTKIKYGDIPDDIVATETDKSSKDKLDNAKLTNTYDTVYMQLLNDKLTALYSLVSECQVKASDSQTLSLLKTASKNIVSFQDQLSALKL